MSDRKINTPGVDDPQNRLDAASNTLRLAQSSIDAQRSRNDPADQLAAMNNTDLDPGRMAAEHEARTAASAAAALGQKGDYDGAMAVLQKAQAAVAEARLSSESSEISARVDLAAFGPDVMAVSVPVVRRSRDVDNYGAELVHPHGTQLNADKMPATGMDEAKFVCGRILTPRGWLVQRALTYQDLPAA